jgi:hypothetical protein
MKLRDKMNIEMIEEEDQQDLTQTEIRLDDRDSVYSELTQKDQLLEQKLTP